MTDQDPTAAARGLMELSSKLMSYSVRFNMAVARGVAPAIREYAESAAKAVETAAQHSAQLAACSSAEEALKAQQAFTEALGDNFNTSAQKLLEMQKESGAELKALVDEGMQEFAPDKLRRG